MVFFPIVGGSNDLVIVVVVVVSGDLIFLFVNCTFLECESCK